MQTDFRLTQKVIQNSKAKTKFTLHPKAEIAYEIVK
jgi:hypothetical protein